MTVFIVPGDPPLTEAQIQERTQAHIETEWNAWQRERSIRLGDGEFNAYMLTVEADTDANRTANAFNIALVAYSNAVARLACYRLADGLPEQTAEIATGELGHDGLPIVETMLIAPAIDPLPATIEQPAYDPETGTLAGVETVPNPAIVEDDAERAAAQAVIDATPPEVIDFQENVE